MPKANPLSKGQILEAMDKTLSNRAAARYLGVSYPHYKKWAKNYDSETHENLFEQHKNQAGKGIPKFTGSIHAKQPSVIDIIEGRIDISHFDVNKIKRRLIIEGHMAEECSRCGFNEGRVTDTQVPLLLYFSDGNKKNYKLDNINLLCYNCYYLTVGDIFSDKQVVNIETDYTPSQSEVTEWELTDYQKEIMNNLGLGDDNDDDDPYSLVSRAR